MVQHLGTATSRSEIVFWFRDLFVSRTHRAAPPPESSVEKLRTSSVLRTRTRATAQPETNSCNLTPVETDPRRGRATWAIEDTRAVPFPHPPAAQHDSTTREAHKAFTSHRRTPNPRQC